MTHDEIWVDASVSAHDRHGSVNIAKNRLVVIGWSEIIGGYNTADTMIEIKPKKYVMK